MSLLITHYSLPITRHKRRSSAVPAKNHVGAISFQRIDQELSAAARGTPAGGFHR
jgi:hypothetical protein